MPYRYLEDIATADVAFEATGASREEMFASAADALMGVMVEDLATIRPRENVEISLENQELDLLLFAFLQEFVFHKDARQLLLRVNTLTVVDEGAAFTLRATLGGEAIEPERHPMAVDVKAVTLHRFAVEKRDGTWYATVILDI
ncbi:MAG: archease [Desulfuromonadales bacterium]|nr:MAG: archease [Desulfuromonadales bacterium]